MAKPKKNRSNLKRQPSVPRPSASYYIEQQVAKAAQAYENDDPQTAYEILLPLYKDNVAFPPVYATLAFAAQALEDVLLAEICTRKYIAMDPPAWEFYGMLGIVYNMNARYAMGKQAMDIFLQHYPEQANTSEIKEQSEFVSEILEKLTEAVELPHPEAFEYLLLSDEVSLYIDHNDAGKARVAVEKMVKRWPDKNDVGGFLAQVQYLEGMYDQAVDTMSKVVEQQPNNHYFTSLLIHYCVIAGRAAEALSHIHRIKDLPFETIEEFEAIIRSLIPVQDNQGIINAYKTAIRNKIEGIDQVPFVKHLVAAAYADEGQTKEARRLWNDILADEPTHPFALENLKDLDMPDAKRNGPFYVSYDYWLSEPAYNEFIGILNQLAVASDETIDKLWRKLLRKYPEIVNVYPYILATCDAGVILGFTGVVTGAQDPMMVAETLRFVQGTRGADYVRLYMLSQLYEFDLIVGDDEIQITLYGNSQENVSVEYLVNLFEMTYGDALSEFLPDLEDE